MPTASELTVDTSASAMDMAEAIFGQGVQVISATYTGDPAASGIYSDAQSTIPGVVNGDSGVILSTGRASDFTNSDGSTDTNTANGSGIDNGGVDGDAQMNDVSGQDTFDGAILEASFIPDGDLLTMQFVFTSEEYPEYVLLNVNDSFGVWVNGQFVEATITTTGNVAIDTVNAGENQNLYRDNGSDQFNTEMDGITYVLTLKAPVNPGEVNTIKIGIADGGDAVYDSNVLIAADSLQTVALAIDDTVQVVANGTRVVDVLANDRDLQDTGLTLTQIMGTDVLPGDTVTLATGEQITLNPDGTLTVLADGDQGSNVMTYTITDGAGNTDVGYLTINTVGTAGPDGIVQGTESGDLIDLSYAGDPDGDRIDAGDALGVGGTTGDGDYIIAGAGDDTILGGEGDDMVFAEEGNDILSGGAGDDQLSGGDGNDSVAGGAGNDIAWLGAGDDSYATAAGDGAGDDTVHGGAGNDTFHLTEADGTDSIDGGESAGDEDRLVFGNEATTDGVTVLFSENEAGTYSYDNGGASGTFENFEAVTLTDNADLLDAGLATEPVAVEGGDGADTIFGGGGADSVQGGAGADELYGGLGADSISGGDGDDVIQAGPDFAAFPEYTLLDGPSQTLTGSQGNTDFDHSATTDGAAVDSTTVPVDGGFDMTGYHVGNAGDETYTHTFTQEVAGAELNLVGIDPGESVTLYLDGVAIDLNQAIAEGWVMFDPGTTGFAIDPAGAIVATGPQVSEPLPAVIIISQPFATLDVEHLTDGGGGDGAVYALAVDTNPPSIYDGEQDTVDGGAGNDLIMGGDGNDQLSGSAGNDTLDGGRGENLVYGGDDRDDITGTGGDTIDGGEGGDDYDRLYVNDVATVLYGGGNNESGTVNFNDGSSLTFGNIEELVVDGTTHVPPDGIVHGTAGDDTIGAGYVDGQGDQIDGTDGNDDTVVAGDGNDSVLAGAGFDEAYGGAGNDTLTSGGAGGPGNDSLYGGTGNDRIVVLSDAGFVTAAGGEEPGDADVLSLQDAGTGGVNVNYTGDEAGNFGFIGGSGGGNFSEIEMLQTTDADDFVNASGSASGVTVLTGAGNDFVTGSEAGDSLDAGAGNDEVFAGGGDDTIAGGDGADNLYGGDGHDSLTGDAGNDYMQGDAGNDTLDGGEGEDFLRGDAGNDTVHGGVGDDQVYGGADDDSVFGGIGNDRVFGGFGTDTVFGGAGNDTITGSGGDDIVHGDDGDDYMQGSDGADTMYGGAGADTLLGEEDADTFYGGAGDYVDGYETVTTGTDNDSLYVTGVQTIDWDDLNPENGTVFFTDGGSLSFFNIENLYVDGVRVEPADGIVSGGAGSDDIDENYTGDPGGDRIDAGDALLIGSAPDDDLVMAGDGDDTVRSGAGEDQVFGGAGNDLILGGAGNDTLIGGSGNDDMTGGGGDDTFTLTDGFGQDSVTGGETAEVSGDVLDASGVTGDIVLDLSAGPGGAEDGTLTTGTDSVSFAEIEHVVLGTGDDSVTGSSGSDSVATGAGADTVDGGAGDDRLDLGSNDGAADVVVFSDGDGSDQITGFEAPIANGDGTFTGLDQLDVSDLTDADGNPVNTADVVVTDTNGDGTGDAVLVFPGGERITLVGVSPAEVNLPGALEAMGVPSAVMPCFTPGARIATAVGEVRVEKLRVGDRVLTRDSGYQTIRWIGRRDLTPQEMTVEPRFQPVRIARGSLGLNLPERDLVVSPQHRMLLTGSRAELLFGEHEVLVAALHLVGRPGITREDVPQVTYIHLLFDRHEIIRADGAWTESYQPGVLTMHGMDDAQRDEILALFPALKLGQLCPAARLSLRQHEAMALMTA